MKTQRMTVAQAIITFLKNQYVERDGQQHRFFSGVLGIFGHGNVAGIGQASSRTPTCPTRSCATSKPPFTWPPVTPRRITG